MTYSEIKKNEEINTYIRQAAEKLGLQFKLMINEHQLI